MSACLNVNVPGTVTNNPGDVWGGSTSLNHNASCGNCSRDFHWCRSPIKIPDLESKSARVGSAVVGDSYFLVESKAVGCAISWMTRIEEPADVMQGHRPESCRLPDSGTDIAARRSQIGTFEFCAIAVPRIEGVVEWLLVAGRINDVPKTHNW